MPAPKLSRRSALKWFTGSATAATALPGFAAPGETEPAPPAFPTRHPIQDPDFMAQPYAAAWPKILTDAELKQIDALADIILPADEHGPAASTVGIAAFMNEWLSAPYPDQREDCETIRGGLAWINTAAFRAHEKTFTDLPLAAQTALVDQIAAQDAAPVPQKFFTTFRSLCLGGYYTSTKNWAQLGYVGNVSIGGPYPGVPAEIIEKLGLQDVA
jgi:hypothetical protein